VLVGQDPSDFSEPSRWLARFDHDGELLWSKKYGPASNVEALSGILPRGDGGTFVLGQHCTETYPHDYQLWMASLASNGDIDWQVSVSLDRWLNCMDVSLHDHGLVLLGTNWPDDPWDGPSHVSVTRLGLDGAFDGVCPLISTAMSSEYDFTFHVEDTDLAPVATMGTVSDTDADFVDVDVPVERLCPE
jgi:hypothetical protein